MDDHIPPGRYNPKSQNGHRDMLAINPKANTQFSPNGQNSFTADIPQERALPTLDQPFNIVRLSFHV
jgi:hypothetical protein